MLTSYKTELKLTGEQIHKINQTIGTCRFIYNFYLAKNKEIYLAIENIFDRKDIISHTSSEYYSTPLNFRVGYRMTF